MANSGGSRARYYPYLMSGWDWEGEGTGRTEEEAWGKSGLNGLVNEIICDKIVP